MIKIQTNRLDISCKIEGQIFLAFSKISIYEWHKNHRMQMFIISENNYVHLSK